MIKSFEIEELNELESYIPVMKLTLALFEKKNTYNNIFEISKEFIMTWITIKDKFLNDLQSQNVMFNSNNPDVLKEKEKSKEN